MNMRVPLRPALVLACLAFPSCTRSAAQQANGAQEKPLQIEVNVNRVLVPVVVRDKQGRAVGDLKQEDFQVFDNDHPRAVSAFTIEKRGTPEMSPAASPESGAQPPALPNAAPQSPSPWRFVVFLFDDLHLSFEDLAYAQKAAAAILESALAPADLAAVVSTSGITNSGFSTDRAKLRDAVKSLRVRSLYRPEGAAGMTDVVSPRNPRINPPAGGTPGISPAKALAEQDLRVTFSTIADLVRRMAALPGQRTLILVSPGFPISQDNLEAKEEESRIFDLAAGSNVTISALDARGLYAAGPSLSPAQENVMAELANATGGALFHNSNDLDAGFKALAEAPEVVYVLELSLDNVKPDGSFHRLKVKVDREGLDVQARHGYYMPKPEKNKK
jgi:VWFA-related protein